MAGSPMRRWAPFGGIGRNVNITARFVCFALPVVSWLAAVSATVAGEPGLNPQPASQDGGRSAFARSATARLRPDQQNLVGAARCAQCHETVHRKWAGARHSKMLQPASASTVLGDFSQSSVTLRGARFALGRTEDRYVIHGPFPTSRDEAHRDDYTLGSRRTT
jgi:hypothetical protein